MIDRLPFTCQVFFHEWILLDHLLDFLKTGISITVSLLSSCLVEPSQYNLTKKKPRNAISPKEIILRTLWGI